MSRRARRQPPKKPPAAAPAAPGEITRREKTLWAGLLLAIYAALSTWGQFDFSDIMGYYDLHADALLRGQLHLLLGPDQVNLVDMIPYEGRYYFQWGPFPVIFHLAARAVGLRLSDRVAALAAGWAAAVLFLEIVLLLRRRHFPEVSKGAVRWFFFAFALATPTALVTLRGTVYNESIGIAAAAILFAFYAFLRAAEHGSVAWTAAAGCGVAAAGLSRITLLLYAGPFFLAFGALFLLRRSSTRSLALKLALLSAPIVAAGAIHAANNYARFGSVFVFGHEYNPARATWSEGGAIRPRAFFENFRHYFLSLPELSADFPWVAHQGWGPPIHVTRAEAVSSLILASPFLLFGLYALPLLGRREESVDLRLAAGLALGGAGLLFALMMSFEAASRRYAQDFVPLLAVFAFIGLGMRARRGVDWRRLRLPARAVFAVAAAWNIHVPFYQSFYTPTPDLNVMRTFVALKPTLEALLPDGPALDREAAIAANDLGTTLLNRRKFPEALDAFEKANAWLPGDPRIERNLALTRQLVTSGGRRGSRAR